MPTAVSSESTKPVTPLAILAAGLERLGRQLDGVADLDPELRAELRATCDLATGLDPYLSSCTTPESAQLRMLAERTRAEDWSADGVSGLEPEMLSGHVEGQMLKFLVRLTRTKRVLEVGMFTGYSALAMAEALPEDGEVVACEINEHVAAFAEQCFRESESGRKITVRVGPAAASLEELAASGEPFGLVFIDADKGGYRDYLRLVLDGGLLADGGLVCVDNTLMQGQPYLPGEPGANGAAIAKFNRAVAEDPGLEQVLLPLRDGLTLVRRV